MTHPPISARSLPAAAPSEMDVDARGISRFLDALDSHPCVEPHSLMVLRGGRTVAEGWWFPYGPDRVHLLYSLSKSFTATAAGLAYGDGLLDLDAPVISYFPEFADDINDPRSRRILVRHIASMASGHLEEQIVAAHRTDRVEPVRGFLLNPPERDPGTVFTYNQPNTYTLAAIVSKVTGRHLDDYLRERLYEPLGIGEALWTEQTPGRVMGFSGLHTTTDAIARLGQLYLNGGVWQGERLLPERWVREATRRQVETSHRSPAPAESPDWQLGYGFQFWMARHGYRGDGAYGQFCLVLPEKDAVVAITAATERMQDVLDAAWEHLLPALGAKGSLEADSELAHRLAELALPAVIGAVTPSSGAPAWTAARFTPAAREEPATGASLVTSPDGTWTLTLDDPSGAQLTVPLGLGGWAVTEGTDDTPPLAASAAWDADGTTLRATVQFLETPHRLDAGLTLTDHRLMTSWSTVPLRRTSLLDQRAPR
ncbi:serine hydrolase domain-containing protein [Streptomyces sp. NPDC056637]|uniref:serine hydrolase domain-containing protein n=1 Tax=unclassified Streptomyces TaxID=2593676 RepID=UPI00365FAF67